MASKSNSPLTRLYENVMGTEKEKEASTKNLDKIAKEPGLLGSLERGVRAITTPSETQAPDATKVNPMGDTYKKGGSVKSGAGWHGFGNSKTGKNNHGF